MEMKSDPDRSARLQYRAFNPSDEVYMKEMDQDLVGLHQAAPWTSSLPNDASAKSLLELITTKSLLAVMICLPPPSDSEGGSANGESPKSQVIGFVALADPGEKLRHHRFAEVGIRLKKEQRGKGYGSEAINWILDWGFLRLGLHKIEISCYEWNPRARRLYERLGFIQEGERREQLYLDGKFWSRIDLGMLESEWKELRKDRAGELSDRVVV